MPRAKVTRPSASEVHVHVWEERDNLQIELRDTRNEQTIAMWVDEDARQMFEDGFFQRGARLAGSVIQYARDLHLLRD